MRQDLNKIVVDNNDGLKEMDEDHHKSDPIGKIWTTNENKDSDNM